jgi:hypothetical protein
MNTVNENVLSKWNELTDLVDAVGVEVIKNAEGNKAAGTRARKGLRSLKATAAELVKLTLNKE